MEASGGFWKLLEAFEKLLESFWKASGSFPKAFASFWNASTTFWKLPEASGSTEKLLGLQEAHGKLWKLVEGFQKASGRLLEASGGF